MAIDNIPVWPFEANWNNEVRETLEWLTDVLQSPSGAEQRRTLRNFPRRMFEFNVVLNGRERMVADRLLIAHGNRDWYLPIWSETHLSSVALQPGDFFIQCASAPEGDLQVGDIVFINTGSPFTFELAEIAIIDETGITLTGPLSKAWPIHTCVRPVRRARLTEQPEPDRQSDDTVTMQLRFRVSQANNDAFTVSTPMTTDIYRGHRVLHRPPDESSRLTYGYTRLVEEFDNGTGIPYRRDTAGISFPKQKYAWVIEGRNEQKAFRKLLYDLRGRAVPIWVPTFFQDFTIADDTPSGESYMIVENTQFTATGGPLENRRDICIEMIHGSRLYRRITGSAVLENGNEALGLSAPLPDGFSRAAVMRISFMALSRLDQDNIEIIHQTDSAGIALVDTTFRAAPEIRDVSGVV